MSKADAISAAAKRKATRDAILEDNIGREDIAYSYYKNSKRGGLGLIKEKKASQFRYQCVQSKGEVRKATKVLDPAKQRDCEGMVRYPFKGTLAITIQLVHDVYIAKVQGSLQSYASRLLIHFLTIMQKHNLSQNVKDFISELRFAAETLEDQLDYSEITWHRASSLLHGVCKSIQDCNLAVKAHEQDGHYTTCPKTRSVDTPFTFSHIIVPGRILSHSKVARVSD